MPPSYSFATITGSRFTLLICCQALKAVHIGDPMSSSGCSALTLAHALSLISSSSKSQCRPSWSWVVRSNANQGKMPKLGQSLATAEARGEE